MAELARIALQVYGQLTSIVYDTAQISELIVSDSVNDEMLLMLANLLYHSTVMIYYSAQQAGPYQETFISIQKLCQNSLPLSKIRSMLQMHSNNGLVVEPILKTFLFVLNQMKQSVAD